MLRIFGLRDEKPITLMACDQNNVKNINGTHMNAGDVYVSPWLGYIHIVSLLNTHVSFHFYPKAAGSHNFHFNFFSAFERPTCVHLCYTHHFGTHKIISREQFFSRFFNVQIFLIPLFCSCYYYLCYSLDNFYHTQMNI